MSNFNQKPESNLVQNISRFSHALSAIAAFMLAPQIAKHLRPEMFHYLVTEFNRELAFWGSWAFVVAAIIASFFGISGLLQLLIHGLIRGFSRKGVF